ncbi:hypothetical protein B0H14DRAFT_236907 [Mycena olivaceomarginata]|nr:hypothetical protein B0H14DRAFT_236907 [Mycena olivaceomarginata]
MDISSEPFFFRCVEENLASVSYTPPQALYLSFGPHDHPARASSQLLLWVRLIRTSVLGHAMLNTPSPVLSCPRASLYSEGCIRRITIAPYSVCPLPRAARWASFLSASNSLGNSRSGVQRHLHRVADCIPGRQITRLRHNHVLAAGFFPYQFTFGFFSFVVEGWETFGVPSL